MNPAKRAVLLGLVFLFFLALSYIENVSFFNYIKEIFMNFPLAMTLVFIHNLLAISLIILGMAFYVEFVLAFLPEKKIERVVLRHPRVFAIVFTVVILFVSILRASTLLQGQVAINTLALVMLFSLPNGILEGYGIFRSIEKTLGRKLTLRDLAIVYSIFFFAAILEVGFVHILLWIST
ncbi:MAG: hypothetical protein ACE5OV_00740 [Candidatus Bathyarchaeia archaeon]